MKIDTIAQEMCAFCEAHPIQVTLRFEEGGPAESTCLDCGAGLLEAEQKHDYAHPKVTSFYVHPGGVREDIPCGEWVRDGGTFHHQES